MELQSILDNIERKKIRKDRILNQNSLNTYELLSKDEAISFMEKDLDLEVKEKSDLVDDNEERFLQKLKILSEKQGSSTILFESKNKKPRLISKS